MTYRLFLIGIITLGLVLLPPTGRRATAQTVEPICFPDVAGITNCISPTFAGYWQSNGGLPIFGYPLTPTSRVVAGEGVALTAQWTERNRLELHIANPPAYRVQLGRIGAERLAQLGRDWTTEPRESGPLPGCLWFAETGRNLCDQGQGLGFRSYWERNGLQIPGLNSYQRSLALFGLPLTSAAMEAGPDGKPILTQWFERARLEWHPTNPARFRVLLGLLGHEVRSAAPPSSASAPWDAIAPFGVEINRGMVAATAKPLAEGGFSWVRYNGVLWAEVETQRGQRDWGKLRQVEQELTTISAQGGTTLLVVRSTPSWAQAVPGKVCGPIRPEALADFASFMAELVTRYSRAPYNVKYWELGNEPDAPYAIVASQEPFGCWGDERQPFFNGAVYAAMLQAAYPAIKAADPEAQVVLGGLLLDCDPERKTEAQPCRAGSFLEGVLRAGGGAFFDITAYHSYAYWLTVRHDWDLKAPKWEHRGGNLFGKRDLLQSVMARYGYQKPLIMNEGGLLCYRADPICGQLGFYTYQANYAIRLFTRSAASDLLGSIWYTLNGPGWEDAGLLDRNQQPRPAFQAARFITKQLQGATYEGQIGSGMLEAHVFHVGQRRITIYWTNDDSQVVVPLPARTIARYSMLGEPEPLEGATLTAGFTPQIIVSER